MTAQIHPITKTCPECDGDQTFVIMTTGLPHDFPILIDCPSCDGNGWVWTG